MPDYIGLRRDDHVQRGGLCVEIGNKELNYGAGILCADGADGLGPVCGTAVRQVVTRHRSNDDIPQFHQCDAFGDPSGFLGVGGKGVSCFRCTEAAASGADVSQDHEGCGSAAPAFGLVRTHAAAANRMQRMFVDYLLYLGIFRGAVEPDLQPSWFFQYIYLVIKLRHLSSLFSN